MSQTLISSQADRLRAKKNVVGVAWGKKWHNGQPTDQDALLVLVEKKESKNSLSSSDLVESFIDGVPTDVVGKIGQLKKLPYTQKERPIKSGISCGHLLTTAGTIGGVFYDREGSLVVLSNNHVLAAENQGKRGHLAIQPGVYDGGWVGDRIGLLKYYRPLASSNGTSFDAANWREIYGYNVEDSAIAQLDSDIASDIVKNIGTINGFRDNIAINESVQKVGRTTQLTSGKIIGIHAEVWVQYDMGILRFKDCILTNNMSQGGDSGSGLFDANRNLIGLLFAGSNSITVYNPIKYPRATYGLSLYRARQTVETCQIIVKHNGAVVPNNYGANDLLVAIDEARSKCQRDGTAININIDYRIN